jgi:hypothetical protein
MLALKYGRGGVASYLTSMGASITARDHQGISVLDTAQETLEELRKMEWTLSRSEYETHAKHLDRERNQKHFVQIIDLCKAHLKTLKAAKKSPGKLQSISQHVTLINSGQGLSTRISVLLNKYTVPMATERKTFACLTLGEPFGDVFAVSGYSQGIFGGIGRCLDREEWTAKVFRFSRAIGHVLKTWERMDAKRRPLMPRSYYASHAEKQVMAYIL